ncbi:MAG: DUF4097 family beta strand repeat-containing protein [Bacillota bacterium]|nr:DUF4097 family beta strand repeat-containing protein [Bacillota bacterium]
MKVYKHIALASLIIGIVLCIVGFFMNGISELPDEAQKLSRYVTIRSYGKARNVSTELSVDNDCDLSLELSATNGTIKYYDGEVIKVKADNVDSDYDFKYDGMKANISFDGVNNKKQAGNVTLYLPKNIRFNNVSLDFDASNITIEALQCNQLDLESDASKVTIKHLQANEKTSVDNDMGDLKLNYLNTNSFDIENDMGNIDVKMAETRNQYHVDKDGSMSSINVSKVDEVIGDKKISIDTDLGNVTIHFEGE